jgi:hypothetical protein
MGILDLLWWNALVLYAVIVVVMVVETEWRNDK